MSRVLSDKKALREETADKSFAEKLQILERMRERDELIRRAKSSSEEPR